MALYIGNAIGGMQFYSCDALDNSVLRWVARSRFLQAGLLTRYSASPVDIHGKNLAPPLPWRGSGGHSIDWLSMKQLAYLRLTSQPFHRMTYSITLFSSLTRVHNTLHS